MSIKFIIHIVLQNVILSDRILYDGIEKEINKYLIHLFFNTNCIFTNELNLSKIVSNSFLVLCQFAC